MREHVGYLTIRLARRAQSAFENAIAPLALRPALFDTLATVAHLSSPSQLEVAATLGVDPARLVGVCDELESAGWLRRTRDPADRRRSALTLTAAGRRLLTRAEKKAAEVEADLLAGLAAADHVRMRSLLAAAVRHGERAGETSPGAG